MKLNIIVPTYKRYSKLQRCLDCFKKYTYQNFTVHVVSDGQDKFVQNIVNDYKQYFDCKYYDIPHEGKLGGLPRIHVIDQLPDNEWIQFVDDDNIANDVVHLLLEKPEDYGIIYAPILHENLNRQIPKYNHIEGNFEFGNIDSLNFLVKTEIVKQCSHKWIHNTIEVRHDYDFIKACSELCKSKYLQNIIVGNHFKNDFLSVKERDLSYQDSYIYGEIVKDNIYDLRSEHIKGKTVVDIGANIGCTSMLFSELGANKILSLEPNKDTFELLEQNTLNYNNIYCLNEAVYDGSEKVTLEDCKANCKVYGNGNVEALHPGELGYEVKATTLDKVINFFDDDEKLILKCDCEGAEFEILSSASKNTIKRFDRIYIEIHGKNIDFLVNYILSLGFSCVYKVDFWNERMINDEVKRVVSPELNIFVFENTNIKKLNIGCGDQILPGYINCDLYSDKADVICDARQLTFEDNYFDEVYSSHVIEHFTFSQGFQVLTEWKRVLKQGGLLKIECPDFEAMCRKFVDSDENTRIGLYPAFFGFPDIPGHTHLFLYTPTQMRWTLEQLGFKNITKKLNETITRKEDSDIIMVFTAEKEK